jgi:hypothetical protein
MSEAAYDLSRKVLRLCRSCAERKARFRIHGVVKADRDHTLCFECFRAERDRRRAQLLSEVPSAAARLRESSSIVRLPESAPSTLTQRATEHRRRMLAHLERVRAQR